MWKAMIISVSCIILVWLEWLLFFCLPRFIRNTDSLNTMPSLTGFPLQTFTGIRDSLNVILPKKAQCLLAPPFWTGSPLRLMCRCYPRISLPQWPGGSFHLCTVLNFIFPKFNVSLFLIDRAHPPSNFLRRGMGSDFATLYIWLLLVFLTWLTVGWGYRILGWK